MLLLLFGKRGAVAVAVGSLGRCPGDCHSCQHRLTFLVHPPPIYCYLRDGKERAGQDREGGERKWHTGEAKNILVGWVLQQEKVSCSEQVLTASVEGFLSWPHIFWRVNPSGKNARNTP